MRILPVLLALCALGAPAPAGASTYDPGDGPLCGFASVTDPTIDGGQQSTVIFGGPYTITNDFGDPARGSLVCTVQVNEPDHTATDGVSPDPATGFGVVYVPPTVVSYNAARGDAIYLCTSFVWAGGPTLYWADGNGRVGAGGATADDPTSSGIWTTDPSAPCRHQPMTFQEPWGDVHWAQSVDRT